MSSKHLDIGEQNVQQYCAVWITDDLLIVLVCSCEELKCK